jgi:hypothetical protein
MDTYEDRKLDEKEKIRDEIILELEYQSRYMLFLVNPITKSKFTDAPRVCRKCRHVSTT